MNEQTSLRYQMISAWCGPLFLLTFVFFWGVLGHNLPNPSSAWSALQVAAHYQNNVTEMRTGLIVALIAVTLYLPWSALLSTQMAQIEGKYPVLAFLQLLGGGLTVMVVSFSAMFWAVAAFRPERDPVLLQLLTDLGWLCIDLQYACTTLQMIAAALAGLADKRTVPLFPRWVCFLTIWCGISFFPASLTGVLKSGPFAWDGFFSYYFPYFCWLCWYITASIYMIREVGRRMREHAIRVAPATLVRQCS